MNIDLDIKVEEQKGYIFISLAGDMDAYTSKKFKNVVEKFIKEGNYKLIVDLERVSCIDSVGAGILLGALRRTRENQGNLYLIYSKSPVKKFFTITNINKSFTIFKDKKQAFQELGIK